MQVDGYRWLYKTDKRAANFWSHGARIWQLEPKRANVLWFLGQDNTKVTMIDEGRPKKPKPYPLMYRKKVTTAPSDEAYFT